MELSQWWLRFTKPFIDSLMKEARVDTDVSLDEYKELKKQHDSLYANLKPETKE